MPEGKEFVIVHDLHKSFGEGDTRQRVLRGTDFAVDRGGHRQEPGFAAL